MRRHFIKLIIIAFQFAFYLAINKIFRVHDRIIYSTFLIYLALNLIKNMYSFKTILIWDELRRQLQVHFEFLVMMLINDFIFMNYLRMWEPRYMWVHVIVGVTFTFFNIMIIKTARRLFVRFLEKRLLIVGIGKTARNLTQTIEQNRFTMYNLLGYISVNDIPGVNQIPQIEETKILGNYNDIKDIIISTKVDEVIIAVPLADNKQMDEIIDKLDGNVTKVKFVPELSEEYTFNSKIEDYDGIMLIASYNGMNNLLQRFLKRTIDIIGGIVGLIILGITTLIYYKKIKKDGGSILFLHNRVGRNLKPFKMYKFRTMVPNAENKLAELLKNDEKKKAEFYKNFKLRRDPRITPIGKFLRHTSIDELPQFINVIKGDMSLVGPRPVTQQEIDLYYGEEMSKKVFMIKPGITGMWQVNGRSDVKDYNSRIAMDLYYIRNWSLWLDIVIMLKTIKAVSSRKGAY